MEIRVLKYFLVIAKEESVTNAAKILHITQPTLSRQIHQLEEELGVRLFNRGTRQLTLTEDGILLRSRAREIVELAEKVQQDFLTDKNSIAGNIVIGCGETYNMMALTRWMKEYRQRYPLVTFQIHSGAADVIMERIENGLADIGLLMEPVDVERYDVLTMPYREKWGIMVAKDSPLAENKEITPEKLTGIPLILPERILVQSSLQRWFGEQYEKIHVAATYNLLLNAMFMVQQGMGAALCYAFDPFFPEMKFIPLKHMPETGAVLAWKKQSAFNKAVRRFLDLCNSKVTQSHA